MRNLKTLLFGAVICVIGLCCCAKKQEKTASPESSSDKKALVCYFSATGTTAEAAKRIAAITGGTLHEITPEAPYTAADLDWTDSLSRSSVEMHNRTSRPAIVDTLPDVSQYDIVFIGYPNWWNTHPTIINTFIESNDFKDKTIVPFMTSGGGDIANSEKELHESYPSLHIAKGLLMNKVTDEEIKAWVEEL